MSSLSVWFKDDFYATLLIWALQKFFEREKKNKNVIFVYIKFLPSLEKIEK